MSAPVPTRELQQAEREKLLELLLLNARTLAETYHGPFIVPAERQDPWSPLEFLKEFPNVAQVTVAARYGVKGVLVLNGRLLRTHNRLRLHEIGGKLGVTREWVRIVEQRIFRMFARIFFLDEYVTARFRIREEFTFPLRDLEQKIRRFRYESFTFSDWARCLQRIWCLHPRELGAIEPLLLGILNYPFLDGTSLTEVPSLQSVQGRVRFTRSKTSELGAARL